MRILIVEDDKVTAKMLRELLLPFDSNTPKTVGTLSDMHRCLSEEKFDVVILDVFMPDCNDSICIPEIESLRDRYVNMAIVVTSGLVGEEFGRRVVRAGADRFLPKAGDVTTVYEVLLSAIERHHEKVQSLELLQDYVRARREGKLARTPNV